MKKGFHFTLNSHFTASVWRQLSRLGLVAALVVGSCNLMWAQTTVVWGNTGSSTAWYTNTNWTPNTASGAWTTSHIAQFQNNGSATSATINIGTANLSIGAIEITSARTRN